MSKIKYGRYQNSKEEEIEIRSFLLKIGEGFLVFCVFYTVAVNIFWHYNPEAKQRAEEYQRSVDCQKAKEKLETARWMRDTVTPSYAMTDSGRSEWERYNNRVKQLEQQCH